MRIVIATTMKGAPWGGSEEMWFWLAKQWAISGHDVNVITENYKMMSSARVCELRKGNVKVFEFKRCDNPSRLVGLSGYNYFQFNRNMRLLDAIKPEKVLVNLGRLDDIVDAPIAKMVLQWSIREERPFWVVPHSMDQLPIVPEERRLEILNSLSNAFCCVYVAPSQSQLIANVLLGVPQNQLICINPTNKPSQSIIPMPPKSNRIRVGIVARLDNLKGIDTAIRCIAYLRQEANHFELNVYGSGTARSFLENQVDFLKVGDAVTFHGEIDDPKTAWAANDIACLLSHREVAPLSIAEAMLCGRAVIATNVGCVGDWVIDGRTGFIAECSNLEYACHAFRRSVLHQGSFSQMGSYARTHALSLAEKYSVDRLANEFVEKPNAISSQGN